MHSEHTVQWAVSKKQSQAGFIRIRDILIREYKQYNELLYCLTYLLIITVLDIFY